MKFIVGNWKMNGSRTTLDAMIKSLNNVDTSNTIILCVPYTMLRPGVNGIQIGAQDVSPYASGAHTGDVSAQMLADAGAKYVIIGHSERRTYYNETSSVIRAKADAAISAGLVPIICIGETMTEKQAGNTISVIESEVRNSLPSNKDGKIIIAYEPRWAIGAGITPTTSEIASAHALIAKTLKSMRRTDTPILYGASVTAENAAEIMAIPNVNGVLVGGASLKPNDFIPIITSVK